MSGARLAEMEGQRAAGGLPTAPDAPAGEELLRIEDSSPSSSSKAESVAAEVVSEEECEEFKLRVGAFSSTPKETGFPSRCLPASPHAADGTGAERKGLGRHAWSMLLFATVFLASVFFAALVASAVASNGDEEISSGAWGQPASADVEEISRGAWGQPTSADAFRRLAPKDAAPQQNDTAAADLEGVCLTAKEGELCHRHVLWAMEDGLRLYPTRFQNLTRNSSFEAFQAHVHVRLPEVCPPPCECHTAAKGEACHDRLVRAMAVDIRSKPELFPGLTAKSRREAFQESLHRKDPALCPMPCAPKLPAGATKQGICEYGHVDRAPGHAGCIVVRKGRLLALQADGDRYDIPTGRSNGHEPARCTAHRETLEGSGFRAAPRELLATVRDGVKLFRCELVQASPLQRLDGAVWLSPEDVRRTLSEGRWRFPDAERYSAWVEQQP